MTFRIGSKQVANGNDYSEVKEWDAAVKSISTSRTFGDDTNDPVKIADYMELLAENVHRALIKDRFLFKVVSIEVRYDDFA
jgi:DNA polymerase IV (archaeal DinB-like DNA polymerase)